MHFTFTDAFGSLLATLICAPILILPGFALASGVRALGFWTRGRASQLQLALIAAFAFLPVLDSLALRLLGLWPAVVLNLALAAWGGRVLWRTGVLAKISPGVWPMAALIAALIFAVAGYTVWDLDLGGRLYVSLLDIDLVKHAATIEGLRNYGAPIADPFFARPGGSGYYYYFYSLGALVEALGLGLFDARAAFCGVIIWTALAVYALACELMDRCGYAPDAAGSGGRLRPLLIGLMLVGGLDIIPVTLIGVTGIWSTSLGSWNEEITPWLGSVLWVPHHVTSLIAVWMGLMLLSALVEDEKSPPRRQALAIAGAGLAFATAFGASVWVTMAGVLAVALWMITLAWERRWRSLAPIVAAGLVASLISLPQLRDLMAYREDHHLPVALTIRAFKMYDQFVKAPVPLYLGRALLLPLNYGLELGVFAFGAALFLRRVGRGELWGQPIPRLLTLTAMAGLLLGTFVKSTIINNDLGWRVILFPQMTTLIWSAVALRRLIDQRRADPSRRGGQVLGWMFFILIGLATNLYVLFALRFYQVLTPPVSLYATPQDPLVRRDLREAFVWMRNTMPLRAVVQQNPSRHRVMDFGLYGRQRAGVADVEAMLFGASKASVDRRWAALDPVFETGMTAGEAAQRARAEGVDLLIATATDPAWANRASWVWAAPPVYVRPNVRVIPVSALFSKSTRPQGSRP